MDADEHQPREHGKANHTPVSQAPDAPQQEREKQACLPASMQQIHALSMDDVAAIEAAAGEPLGMAVETAVRVETLADEIPRINEREGLEDSEGAEDSECAVQLRRSSRAGAGSIDRFADTKHAAWGEYDASRLDSRHAATRDVSYEELVRQ